MACSRTLPQPEELPFKMGLSLSICACLADGSQSVATVCDRLDWSFVPSPE